MVVDFGRSETSRNNADPLEVKLAGEVQKLLLPKGSPLCSWCCLAARSRMANVLGGDFYDFIKLENGCHILLVGDVTGQRQPGAKRTTRYLGHAVFRCYKPAEQDHVLHQCRASCRPGETPGQGASFAGHKPSGRLFRTGRVSDKFVSVRQ